MVFLYSIDFFKSCMEEAVSAAGWAQLSLILLQAYSRERGKLQLKHFFYWFYPAHLMAIGIVETVLMGT